MSRKTKRNKRSKNLAASYSRKIVIAALQSPRRDASSVIIKNTTGERTNSVFNASITIYLTIGMTHFDT